MKEVLRGDKHTVDGSKHVLSIIMGCWYFLKGQAINKERPRLMIIVKLVNRKDKILGLILWCIRNAL